jgi:hypothetical protein
VLSGRDKTLLDDTFTEDLVALVPVDTEQLNVFLQENFGYFLRVSINNYKKAGGVFTKITARTNMVGYFRQRSGASAQRHVLFRA